MIECKRYKIVVSVSPLVPDSLKCDNLDWVVIEVTASHYDVIDGDLHLYSEPGQTPFMSYSSGHWACIGTMGLRELDKSG